MLKNWTFLYSVTKNLQKFKSNHNPSIELLKSVINSFTSQTVLWNFCVCVCVCVFSCQWVHTEGHRWLNLHWAEETICQDPLSWLTSLHIRAEKSGRRGGKEDGSDREWRWEKVKREEERQARREIQEREGWGTREDTLLMPRRLWAGRLTLTFIPQSSSSRSFPRTHPTAHRPGEVYEHDWGSLPTMKFLETALFIRWKHIHQSPRRASERAVIRALPPKTFHSFVCLFFPDRGSSVDLDGPSLAQRAITSNKTSFKMYISQVMGEGRILGCSNSQRLKKGIKHVALAVFGEFNKYICPSALVFPPPSSQDVHGEWAAWIRVSVH